MKKLVFVSNMAAPYQVKFCLALQAYFDAEIWFYVQLESNRPKWWAVPLGEKCRILKGSFYIPILNYNNLSLLKQIKKHQPEILLVGGFFLPSHYLLKKWAKRNNVKFVVLSEKVSYKSSNKFYITLKKHVLTIIYSLFKDMDLILAIGEKPLEQFTKEFGFNADKVVLAQYPQDIDVNLKHDLRKTNEIKTIIFPNRLDQSYNPIFALQVFKAVNKLYPELKLLMNSSGELKEQCRNFIQNNNLSSEVEFLDKINAWDDLPEIYRRADIALFTATDSNGPNTLIECMASGTGIILSKYIHNTGAYAINNENCFICDLDIEYYVKAITQYIKTDGLIAKHGSLSKKMVANRSIEATAKLYSEIIEKNLFALNNKLN